MSSLLLMEEIANRVLLITLNRPQSSNALSLQLVNELTITVNEINDGNDYDVVIFTGAGEKAFCAGADLKERLDMNEQEVGQTVGLIRRMIEKVAELNKPTIAAMNGSALGGGLELALACDLRVGCLTGIYGLTETSLAVIPGAGGTQRLPRLIGVGRAKEMIFTAAKVTGAEAYKIGLMNNVEEQEHVLTKALEIAERITKNGPIAVQKAKKAIDLGMQGDLKKGQSIEALAYEQTIATSDRLEGLRAFQEKRVPDYKGR